MAVYMITYDLNKQGQNYDKVIGAIKDCSIECYSGWESSYLIKSSMTAKQIRDNIAQYLDGNDALLVIEVKNNYNGRLEESDCDILREKIFN